MQQHAKGPVHNAVFRDDRRRAGHIAGKLLEIVFKTVHSGNVTVFHAGMHAVCAYQALVKHHARPDRKGLTVQLGQQHARAVRYKNTAPDSLDVLFRPGEQLKNTVHDRRGVCQNKTIAAPARFQFFFWQNPKLRAALCGKMRPAAQPGIKYKIPHAIPIHLFSCLEIPVTLLQSEMFFPRCRDIGHRPPCNSIKISISEKYS